MAEATLPAWLHEPDPPTNGEHAAPLANEELPAWLRSDQHPASTAPSATDELPPWLRDSAPSSAAAPSVVDELPPWLQTPAAATPSPQAPAMAAHEDLPEWLRFPAEPSATMIPPATPSPPPADELPDWLRHSEQPVSEQGTQPPPLAVDGLPDWLREAETPVTAAETPSQATSNQATHPPTLDDSELPDWLRNTDASPGATVPFISGEQPVVGATQSLPTADMLPAWLQDTAQAQGAAQPITAAEPPQPPAPAAEAVDESEPQLAVPDWLTELGIDSVAETSPAPAPLSQAETASTPSWLEHGDAPATAAGEYQLPSWLTDVSDSSPAAQLPPSEHPVAAQDHLQAVSDLPAWLTVADDPAPIAQPATFGDDAGMSSTSADSSQALAVDVENEHELPAWLRDGADEHHTTAAPHHAHVYEVAPSPPAAADTPLPTWLTGFNEPTPQPPSSSLPSWLAEQPSQEVAPTPATPAPANEFLGSLDLPDWLREPVPEAPAPAHQSMPSYLDTPSIEAPTPPLVAPPVAPARRTITRTPQRLEAVALLQRLQAEAPAEPAPVVPPRKRRGLQLLLLVIVLLIIIGAVAAIVFGQQILRLLGAA